MFTSFAVLGAGLLGVPIVNELQARGASVLVIAPPGKCTPESKRRIHEGIPVEEADYNDIAGVARLLQARGVQVVVSTVSAADVALQNRLASAAKEAGVQLFVPSEFGLVTEDMRQSGEHISTIEHLRSLMLAYARFYAGIFIETIPALTGLAVNGKINLITEGDMPCSFTASEDVAGFVAHVLTTFPFALLINQTFRLQGDRCTLSELSIIFNTDVAFVDELPGKMGPVWTKMQLAAACGTASTGWDVARRAEGEAPAGCTNYLWKGHVWKSIRSFYNL